MSLIIWECYINQVKWLMALLNNWKNKKRIGKLETAKSKKHTYLAIDLDYSKPGETSLRIINYGKEILKAFPEQEKLNRKTQPN